LNSFHEQLEEFQQCRRILLQCCNECSAFSFVLLWFICLSNTLCNKLHFQQYWSLGTIRFRGARFWQSFPTSSNFSRRPC